MKLETFQYTIANGWTIPTFPMMDSPNTLILVFASPAFFNHPKPIQQLAAFYSQSKMLGCSSAGEIYNTAMFDDSLTVAVISFEKTTLKLIKTEVDSTKKSFEAGKETAMKLNHKDLRGIFILSEGLGVNGSELVKGLNAGTNKEVIITGGLAGDGKDFKHTWIIHNNEICSKSLVAVGFYGNNIQIGHGSQGGWDIFGPERLITRSKDNILYELDGRPALALYKEYLGDQASGLPGTGLRYPLAIRENSQDERRLVRAALSINEEEQSLTFAGDVPQGYLAQLMHANFDRLIDSASEAGELAIERMFHGSQHNKGQILSIVISCVARRYLLGERTDEEIESVFEMFPSDTKQVGFYSYGEISPYATGNCDLHNQTMTLTTISEY